MILRRLAKAAGYAEVVFSVQKDRILAIFRAAEVEKAASAPPKGEIQHIRWDDWPADDKWPKTPWR